MNINFLKEKFRKIFLREWETLDSVLWFAMGVFAAALILVMFWESATLTIGELLGISDKADILKFIGLGMGGLLAALGAIALNRRAEAQIKSADAQADVAAEQAKNNRLTEKGHVQDRFKAAVEHLGSERAEMKIAAYHELYQLARERKENSDLRRIIFEILCAHLRQLTNASEYKKNHGKYKPTEGVQTLLDLLFKSEDSKAIFQGLKANLQRVYLVGADLSYAHMIEVDFKNGDLRKVNMAQSTLWSSSFFNTQMHNVNFYETKMQCVRFYKTVLQGAKFRESQMQFAHLYASDCRGAHFTAVNLQCAQLFLTDFRGAALNGMRCQSADLFHCKFGGATAIYSHNKFETLINNGIGQKSEINKFILYGSITNDQAEKIMKSIPNKEVDDFRAQILPHIDKKSPSKLTPEEIKLRRIDLSAYSKEEAEQWIAEYKEATDEISEN